ncbi:MAG: hypothetical protein A2086_12470 [Spirochaetes bacterium GWD1_27_9]|nr:MAG: hypothetical protein A2Z98_07085 [Spirochaetes bacterium GWB1_27_13]OHD21507.1 MAG: hypothetical protein A2Y34_01515 [Spirochaetes bacterium GWC1_27_15]OHD32753.1 MAG: hypothetical protein A2086_12470 [Spirochaetes bacterium GWD1_27_9]
MKKMFFVCLALIFIFGCVETKKIDYSIYYNSLSNEYLIGKYDSEEKVKAIEDNQNASTLDMFEAGIFYLYSCYGSIKVLNFTPDKEKSIVEKSIALFDKAYKNEPKNAYILAFKGAAYLYYCKWGTVLEKVVNGRKGEQSINYAIKILPSDIQLRNIRANSFAYLPIEYYPESPNTVLKDSDFIINNIEKDKAKYSSIFGEKLTDYYYYNALLFKAIVNYKMGNPKEAAEYSAKIPKDSEPYIQLKTFLKTIEEEE